MLNRFNDAWSGASKLLNQLVDEGHKFSWRKSYNDTKKKRIVEDFKFILNIYEVRKSRYLKVRMLGKYRMPNGLDELCSDLFSLSLTHKLVAIDAKYLEVIVEESTNGETNIDETVMEAMMEIQKKVAKQLKIRSAKDAKPYGNEPN